MNKKKVVWNKIDGSEIVLEKSDICPISGKWLIPANCTEIQPPKNEKNNKIHFQKGKWREEEIERKKEVELVKVSEVNSLEDQIQELKAQIEELKFEKNEMSLALKFEKENLLNEIENTQEELKNIRKEIENAREEIIELSNSISEAREKLNFLKGADENGFETDFRNRSF